MSNQEKSCTSGRRSLIVTSEINLHAQCVQGVIWKSTFTVSSQLEKKKEKKSPLRDALLISSCDYMIWNAIFSYRYGYEVNWVFSTQANRQIHVNLPLNVIWVGRRITVAGEKRKKDTQVWRHELKKSQNDKLLLTENCRKHTDQITACMILYVHTGCCSSTAIDTSLEQREWTYPRGTDKKQRHHWGFKSCAHKDVRLI